MKQIKGKEFLTDMRSGMTAAELMEKYHISGDGLRKIFRKLVDASAMSKGELEGLPTLYTEPQDPTGLRRFPRKRPRFQLWICDDIEALEMGLVLDVSEKGVRVEGIRASIGDTKTFIVRYGPNQRRPPFVFEGVCRWIDKKDKPPKKWISGFEITQITSLDSDELHRLMLD